MRGSFASARAIWMRQRAGDLDALLHPARQLRRVLAPLPRQAHQVEESLRPGPPLAAPDAAQAQAEADVLQRRQPVVQAVVPLEHDAAIRARPFHHLPIEQDAPGRRRLEPGDHVQHRGLAAARGAEQAEELPLLKVEGEVAHRLPGAGAPAIGLAHAFQRYQRHATGPVRPCSAM
jgi:hypothetical protein